MIRVNNAIMMNSTFDGKVNLNLDIDLDLGDARRLPDPSAIAVMVTQLLQNKVNEVGGYRYDCSGITASDLLCKRETCESKTKPVVNNVCNFDSIQTLHINETEKIVTVVLKNGNSAVVKCSPTDEFDTEVGFALAYTRSKFGSKSRIRRFIENNAKVTKKPIKKKRRGRKPGSGRKPTSEPVQAETGGSN